MPEQGEDDDMVLLPYGFQARRRFTSPEVTLRAAPVTVTAEVEFVDGVPLVRGWNIACDEPLDLETIGRVAFRPQILDHIVRFEITGNTAQPASFPDLDRDEFVAFLATEEGRTAQRRAVNTWIARADDSARRSRRANAVTPERLRRILDIYEHKDIHAVMEQEGMSERNARRLVARARKELDR